MTQNVKTPAVDGRLTLGRASSWIGRFGVALIVVGAVLAICGKTVSMSLPTVKMVAAILFWIVPGLVYLLTARALLQRKRWAITSANVTTYAQLVIAGIAALVAFLFIKSLWPIILISGVWIAFLLQTPPRLVGLSEAMDQLAARVTDR